MPVATAAAIDIVTAPTAIAEGSNPTAPTVRQERRAAAVLRSERGWFDPEVSAWAIVRRSGQRSSLATNGQLGASQAGVRIQHRVWDKTDHAAVSLNLRFSSPLDRGIGKEAGAGLAISVGSRFPAELIVERRIAIDRGGRDALAVIAAGGIDDRPMPLKFSLSGYAQGGIVGARRGDGFVDGAARIERRLAAVPHGDVRVGVALWGGAQPGVSRLDVGPLLAVRPRIGGAAIRLSAEYRWRIAGRAQPGSGPALSIGTSF